MFDPEIENISIITKLLQKCFVQFLKLHPDPKRIGSQISQVSGAETTWKEIFGSVMSCQVGSGTEQNS